MKNRIALPSAAQKMPLYKLVDNRESRAASRSSNLDYWNAFASHPDFDSINFHSQDTDKTIKQLFDIKEKTEAAARDANVENIKVWNHKFTLSMYKMLAGKTGNNSKLYNDYKTAIYQIGKEKSNLIKQRRYESLEEGEKMKARQKLYDARTREKKKQKQGRLDEVLIDQPLVRHLGIAFKENRRTLSQVVEEAKMYRHLYTTRMAYDRAIEVYLRHNKYDTKEYRRELDEKARIRSLQRMKIRNDRRREAAASSSSSLIRGGYPRQSKKARIDKYLASTDWWQTHNL